ncbi:hypothetical protein D3C84_1175780 [compost metagenome]
MLEQQFVPGIEHVHRYRPVQQSLFMSLEFFHLAYRLIVFIHQHHLDHRHQSFTRCS